MTRRRELHGQRGTRLYTIWRGMNQRCTDPKHTAWASYGGRGITVTVEWYKFTDFQSWALNSGYTDGLTLDRIDGDDGYKPSNCRWATRKQQAENSSVPVLVTIWGESMNITDWARDSRCRVLRRTLSKRIQNNWDPERAVTTPSRQGTWEVSE